jgi:hypothetical protein
MHQQLWGYKVEWKSVSRGTGGKKVEYHCPIQWVQGALSLGVKRPRREADHLPPSSVEVKNAWSYTSTPQYVFMAWCLVKHRDNFTLYLLHRFEGTTVR